MPDEETGGDSTTENTDNTDNSNTGGSGEEGGEETTTIPISTISLDKTEIGLLNSSTETLTATIAPEDCTETEITWSSDSPSIAAVDSSGHVTADAVNTGVAVITVRSVADSTIFAECSVTVTSTPIEVSGVTLNQTTLLLEEGDFASLTASVSPATATDKTVSWSSSNENIAIVSAGLVTAVSHGNAVITVTTNDGSKTASCVIQVQVPSYTLGYYRDASDSDPYELNFAQNDTATLYGNQFGFDLTG